MVPVQITVKLFDCNTRIGVYIERCGWAHSFEIKLKKGRLPEGYESDPDIMAAYRQVQAAAGKWQMAVGVKT